MEFKKNEYGYIESIAYDPMMDPQPVNALCNPEEEDGDIFLLQLPSIVTFCEERGESLSRYLHDINHEVKRFGFREFSSEEELRNVVDSLDLSFSWVVTQWINYLFENELIPYTENYLLDGEVLEMIFERLQHIYKEKGYTLSYKKDNPFFMVTNLQGLKGIRKLKVAIQKYNFYDQLQQKEFIVPSNDSICKVKINVDMITPEIVNNYEETPNFLINILKVATNDSEYIERFKNFGLPLLLTDVFDVKKDNKNTKTK